MTAAPQRQLSAHRFGDVPGVLMGRIADEDRLYRGMKDRFAYVVARRGWSEFVYRGGVYRTGPGVLRLTQPGEMYRELRLDGPLTYDVVLLDVAEIEAARAALGGREMVFASPVLAREDARARPLLELHALLARGAPSLARETAAVEAAAALMQLATSRAEAPGRERPAVRKARAYLLERLAEHVRLDDLADHVRVDKYHLIRAFRSQLGVPPYEYLTHARIFRARELLRAGWSPSQVAPAVGYYDQSQLHRHFRRLTGVTPGQYASRWRPTAAARELGEAVSAPLLSEPPAVPQRGGCPDRGMRA